MKNEMPQLPYPSNGLEPVISAETIEYHYGKHLQTYVTHLINLVKGTEYEQKDIEHIVKDAPEGGIYNNAGQVLNHTLYFLQFTTPGQGKQPEGKLNELILRDFGSLDELKKQMEEALGESEEKEEEKMTRVVHVEGMMCNHCVMHVKKALENLGLEAEVSLDEKKATIKGEASKEEIQKAIEDAGYEFKGIE